MTSLYQIEVYMNKIVYMCMNDPEETIIIRIKDSLCVQTINIDKFLNFFLTLLFQMVILESYFSLYKLFE